MCEIGWKDDRLLHSEAQLKLTKSLKPFRRGLGVFFLVFGDWLFSEFSTRFFEIFAYLDHFKGRWKWKKCEKSRSRGAWSPIWVQGLREVYRGSFRQKRLFVHDRHEKRFRLSQHWYGQNNSESPEKRGKIVSAKFLMLWDWPTKGFSSAKRSESLLIFVFEKKAKLHRWVNYSPCCRLYLWQRTWSSEATLKKHSKNSYL